MLVYRLEDRTTHQGPFSSDRNWPKKGNDYEDSMHSKYGCTLPIEYKYGPFSKFYRFGGRNMTQIKKYWGKQLKFFLNEDWVVAIYKVRKNYVIFSDINDIEIAFKADKAERIGEVEGLFGESST